MVRLLAPALAAVLALGGGPATGGAAPDAAAVPGKMPPLKPAVFDEALVVGGESIDAKKLRSRMTVAVGINGRGPYRFVVDSGADSSVIGLRAANGLKLPPGRPVMLNSMTETTRVNRVLVDELRIGPTAIRDLELPALRDHDIGADGMVGLDALVEQRLMLDFEKRTISVDDARRPLPRLDGEIVVVGRLERGQLILTQVKANGRPIEAVVDTGSEITIGNLALRDLLIRHRAKFTTVEVTGVTGKAVDLQMTTIDELELGSVVMRNIPIAFAQVPPFAVFGLEATPSLLLGTDLMESFRKVSLDFKARKVRFQLRSCDSSSVLIASSRTVARLIPARGETEVCRR